MHSSKLMQIIPRTHAVHSRHACLADGWYDTSVTGLLSWLFHERQKVLRCHLETGWKPCQRFNQDALVFFRAKMNVGNVFIPFLASRKNLYCSKWHRWTGSLTHTYLLAQCNGWWMRCGHPRLTQCINVHKVHSLPPPFLLPHSFTYVLTHTHTSSSSGLLAP